MNYTARTVFIVDDAPEVRMGLTRVLSAAGYPTCAFESAERFLEEQDEDTPGCLLLDIDLPGLSGIDLQHKLIALPFARPIIFLFGVGGLQAGVDAMKEAVVDFLTKPVDDKQLIRAVELAFLRDSDQRLQRLIRLRIQRRLAMLTPREQQVMAHVIRSRLNERIASDLGAGEKTVKVDRARVMSKIDARSDPELVQLAARVGVAVEPALAPGAASADWGLT